MKHAIQMVADGADLLDVGGESTRPGSDGRPADEESRRVVPVIRRIADERPDVPVSVDTRKSDVARAALEAGATIVNDVSAGADPAMFGVVAEHRRRHGPDAHEGRAEDDAGRSDVRRRRR